MTEKTVKVLYIAGTMRSGSTLLARLLGETAGAVDVGELGLLFSPHFRGSARCGCLKEVYNCDFWRAVFDCAFGGIERINVKALGEIRQAYRLRTLPRLLLRREPPPPAGQLQDYLDALDALYRAVHKVSGARLIVDASKDPISGYLLHQAPSVDLRAVHLVRDSRAVAYSQMRAKSDPPLFANPGQTSVVKPLHTALAWNAVNALLAVKPIDRRTLFLRYEDFVTRPEAALRRLWTLMDEPIPGLSFLQEPVLRLHTSHTVAGNPDRFQSEVKIRPDTSWQRNLPSHDRRLVTALTYPLLLQYGYLRSRPSEKDVEEAPHVWPACVL